VKNKFFGFFLIFSFFSLQFLSAANAVDKPTLRWERGLEQSITLGGNTDSQLWRVSLAGQNSLLEFERSKINNDGFFVYSLLLPETLPLGAYEVQVAGIDNQITVPAYVEVVPLISYDIASDPKTFGFIAVVAFTLLSLLNSNRNEFDTELGEDSSSLGSVDTNYHGTEIGAEGFIDRKQIGKNKLNTYLDSTRTYLITRLSPESPIATRVLADGTYLQALAGYLFLPILLLGTGMGIYLGVTADFNQGIIPTNYILILSIVLIGIFDSLAGLLAWLGFTAVAISSGAILSITDIRALLGFSFLLFTPILVAGATRPLRRPLEKLEIWERISDIAISTLLTGWAVKGMALAVDGFAQQKTVVGEHANSFGYLAAAAVLLRYLLEDVATRFAPRRIEFLTPARLQSQTFSSFMGTLLVRVLLYLFFMYGFFGASWQVLVAIAILVVPTFLGFFKSSFPNFPKLFQILPSGIPAVIILSYIGLAFGIWIDSLPLIAEDKSKTILVLSSIPGLVFSLLKLIGRSPAKNDVKWYRRPKFNLLYKGLGPVALLIATLISAGVLP